MITSLQNYRGLRQHPTDQSRESTSALTFGGCVGAVGGNLPHPSSVATQRNQPGDDCCLAKADVSNYHHTSVHAGVRALQLDVNFLEYPVPAHKHRLCGDTGDFKKQWFQRNVRRSIRRKMYCKGSKNTQLSINFYFKSVCWYNASNPFQPQCQGAVSPRPAGQPVLLWILSAWYPWMMDKVVKPNPYDLDLEFFQANKILQQELDSNFIEIVIM